MQTHEFTLKQLRTLGIILTCGALAVGCAGNGVKPATPETQSVAEAPVSQTDSKSPETQPTETMTAAPAVASASESAPANGEVAEPAKEIAPLVAESGKTAEENTEMRQPAQLTFYFGFNKTELSDADKAILVEHAHFLKANPSLILQVNGHTGRHGSRQYNEYLSKQRAESVAKVLIAEGVTRSQMVINALADDKASSDQSGKKDRRVELEYNEINLVSTP